MLAFRDRLSSLLAEHADDNEGLKEESHHYILPAIAVYRTLQETTPNALLLFREMWMKSGIPRSPGPRQIASLPLSAIPTKPPP